MLTLTNRLYYEEPYLTTTSAVITAINPTSRSRVFEVELDQTNFYAQGGGQPSDQGEIVGSNGALKVTLVRNVGENIVHEGNLAGILELGDTVEAAIKWPRRLKYMRLHSAGHLIHDVLMSMGLPITPLKGNHGDKAALEYSGVIPAEIQSALLDEVMSAVKADLPIVTRETSRDELEAMGLVAPATLPQHKGLRIIQIGAYPAMPDGGVHVRSTAEIGNVVIHNISSDAGNSVVRYGVAGSA